ncbi:MAG: hypothetical protein HOG49_00635, partial [Candidatus Scalindua sp.]|nr:hypothetical protein [Candidatus Scalindua sp.]
MFPRSGVWYTCIRYKGRKVQRSLGVKVGKKADEMLALNIESKIRTEIVEGSYFEKLVGDDKTFSQLLDRFMREYAPKKSVNMQKSYTASSKHLIPFFGKESLASITSKKISKYKVVRYEEG